MPRRKRTPREQLQAFLAKYKILSFDDALIHAHHPEPDAVSRYLGRRLSLETVTLSFTAERKRPRHG